MKSSSTKATLDQLLDARRPPLFSRMPRMLRGDGRVAFALEDLLTHPAPLSAHRWNIALQRSRVLRVLRRTAGWAR